MPWDIAYHLFSDCSPQHVDTLLSLNNNQQTSWTDFYCHYNAHAQHNEIGCQSSFHIHLHMRGCNVGYTVQGRRTVCVYRYTAILYCTFWFVVSKKGEKMRMRLINMETTSVRNCQSKQLY